MLTAHCSQSRFRECVMKYADMKSDTMIIIIIIEMNWDTASYMRNFLSRNSLYRIELGLIGFYRVQSACSSSPSIVAVVVQFAIYFMQSKLALAVNAECREKVRTHIVDSFTIRKMRNESHVCVCEATAAA